MVTRDFRRMFLVYLPMTFKPLLLVVRISFWCFVAKILDTFLSEYIIYLTNSSKEMYLLLKNGLINIMNYEDPKPFYDAFTFYEKFMF